MRTAEAVRSSDCSSGLCSSVLLFRAVRKCTHETLGNFFSDYLKTCTRILLPICLVIAVLLMMSGMPMTMEGKQAMITLQGDTTQVSTGPVAAFVDRKSKRLNSSH